MISVKVSRHGPDMGLVIGRIGQQLKRKLHGAMTASVMEWRRIVISTVWFQPPPSSGAEVIARWRGYGSMGFILEYGWVNFRGDQGRAEYRMSLRARIFEPRVLDRVERMVNEAMSGGGSTV